MKVYIMKKPQEIWQPPSDTCHITSLWRQYDQLYFTAQDWAHEEVLDLFRINNTNNNNANNSTGSSSPQVCSQTRSSSNARAPTGNFGRININSGKDNNNPSLKVRSFSLQYVDHIWQLSWLRFEKKFLLGIAACRGGHQPELMELMEIPFKGHLKLLSGLDSKKILWPTSYFDNIPHTFIYHQPTRTWLLFLPVIIDSKNRQKTNNNTDISNTDNILDKQYWLQFRLDATRKKCIWHRFIPLSPELLVGQWLFYDEIRDVLIGWKATVDNNQNKYYELKFLPNISKLLWVEELQHLNNENENEKENANDETEENNTKNTKETTQENDNKNSNNKNETNSKPKKKI